MANNDKRKDLIDQLSTGLKPVKPFNVKKAAVYLFGLCFFIAIGLLAMAGSFRSGALHQLLHSNHFLVESLVGIIAISALIYAAFETAIPSNIPVVKRMRWAVIMMLVWIGFYVIGLVVPAFAPSMLGKREFCYVETFIFALPLLTIGMIWCNRLWPAHPVHTGAMIGLVSGSIPAFLMQFACMYEPAHILQNHILPGLSVGLVGAIVGLIILKTR